MKLRQFDRPFVLSLAFALLGSIAGCGPQSQQSTLDKLDDDGMLVERKGIREFNKKVRESAKAKTSDRKSTKPRLKPGP